MQKLTIEAVSPASAHALLEALAGFQAELVEGKDGRSEVVVKLSGDLEIVSVLNALEEHVNRRAKVARVEFEGRTYTMHPELDAQVRSEEQGSGQATM